MGKEDKASSKKQKRWEGKEKVLNISIYVLTPLAGILALLSVGSFYIYSRCHIWVHSIFPNNTHDYAVGISVTLASLTGVILIFVAFLGQRLQLIYQQQELRDNRDEMKKSTTQLKKQARALNKQIKQMKEDSIVQTFFRILEQHFLIRNSVVFRLEEQTETGDKAFHLYFDHLINWMSGRIDAWKYPRDIVQADIFLKNHGYNWVPMRLELEGVWNLFFAMKEPEYPLLKNEVAFLIRTALRETSFGSYQRSYYYLFRYMMDNGLEKYLDAVEAGMGQWERVFLFYHIVTRFDVDERTDLKDWLIDHRFLSSIERKHLIFPSHMEWIYPIGSEPQFKEITQND
ncbi:hypothetical protein ADIS_3690 [Lunatimonas lonarensis]|uniref:Phage abortive infection protein n=1 Tax=Lunatimonas lonarensis TaxID=1232681 RepID=R7ZP49_9BACT|nr:hypothetical protein [Lunatimonas lonarensis]EON75799.1 hypothetical protein ADIS_3690 [Lunatimonas lonarensis]